MKLTRQHTQEARQAAEAPAPAVGISADLSEVRHQSSAKVPPPPSLVRTAASEIALPVAAVEPSASELAAILPVASGAVGVRSYCPQWFLDGVQVEDVFQRSGDAEFILDGDFEEDEGVCVAELDWRECAVPVESIQALGSTMDQHIMALVNKAPRASLAEERDRYAGIRGWVDSIGGIEKALDQSPLLLTIRGGVIKIEDGYHRLGVAVFGYGATTVKAICAELS